MEIIGKMALNLDVQRGESVRGSWVKGGFVIETEEQYPKKIAFSIWGEEKTNELPTIPIGATIKVLFDMESREYNGRWYTELRCYDYGVKKNETQQQQQRSKEELKQVQEQGLERERKREQEEKQQEQDLPF